MRVNLVKRTQPQGEIWVCDCCMLSRENGECCEDHSANERAADGLWSRMKGIDVTHGRFMENHECEKNPEHEGFDENAEAFDCDCEEREFSQSSCDGCGNRLHGTRHAYTWWR